MTRSDSVCGCPALSSQPLSLNPAVVTTSVSPSHSSDRVAQPRRIGILRQIAAIGEHRPMRAVGRLVQDHHQRRRLDDPRQVEEVVERDADRQALRERAVFPRVAHALQEQRLGPRLDVLGLEILRDVEAVDRAGASPDAGEIRLAVRRPRRGRRQVRLAVGQARDSRASGS